MTVCNSKKERPRRKVGERRVRVAPLMRRVYELHVIKRQEQKRVYVCFFQWLWQQLQQRASAVWRESRWSAGREEVWQSWRQTAEETLEPGRAAQIREELLPRAPGYSAQIIGTETVRLTTFKNSNPLFSIKKGMNI